MEQFYDSANWRNIPHGGLAALYRDGRYAAPIDAPEQLELQEHRWITIDTNYRECSIIDWEPDNPSFTGDNLVRFVRGRVGMLKTAIVYVDRVDVHPAFKALAQYAYTSLLEAGRTLWWIATLDNREWTAQELAYDLDHNWDAPIPAADIWANQYADDGQKDTSRLFLPWR